MTSPSVKFITLNAGNDRRIDGKNAGEKTNPYLSFKDEYGIYKRIPELIETVKECLSKGVIIGLLEIELKTSEIIQKALDDSIGVINKPYNGSNGAFRYVIFYPATYKVEEVNHVPLTKDGKFIDEAERPKTDADKKSDVAYQERTLGEFFEKSFVHVKFSIDGSVFNYCIAHIGLRNKSKIAEMQKMHDWIDENIDGPVFVAGDFNSFVFGGEGVLYEQMRIFDKTAGHGESKDGGDFTPAIKYEKSTFEPYIYDIAFKLSDEDRDKYFGHVKTIKETGSEDAHKAFYDFCYDVKKKETKPVALDNVFYKNVKTITCYLIPGMAGSDHSGVYITATI